MAVTPNGAKVYVPIRDSTNVIFVDVVDDLAHGGVTVGSDPAGIAIGMVPVL